MSSNFSIWLHIVPPRLFKPFFVTLPSPASHFVVTVTCLVIVISSNIMLRTIFVLWWLDLYVYILFLITSVKI